LNEGKLFIMFRDALPEQYEQLLYIHKLV
jgi:hypothetical protein